MRTYTNKGLFKYYVITFFLGVFKHIYWFIFLEGVKISGEQHFWGLQILGISKLEGCQSLILGGQHIRRVTELIEEITPHNKIKAR